MFTAHTLLFSKIDLSYLILVGRVFIEHDALKVDGASKYTIFQVKVESWSEVYKHVGLQTHEVLYALFERQWDLRGKLLRGDHLVIGGIIHPKEIEGSIVKCVIVEHMWLELAKSKVIVIEGDGDPSYKTYTGFFKHLCDLRSVLDTQECPY
ncbi:unnamed protein product [Cylicocyclus nassatus]|uniref:Uncharacterized protein n=1 Tax=Cylicocyclus nassatus TaxID=53992 RepID=A0AA36GRI3_CYLNA|nr:unnamed protein product [Cylicocyclus nassatus]